MDLVLLLLVKEIVTNIFKFNIELVVKDPWNKDPCRIRMSMTSYDSIVDVGLKRTAWWLTGNQFIGGFYLTQHKASVNWARHARLIRWH